MKNIKMIALLLSITACLVLCGIGFSMWYNVQYSQNTTVGTLETYDVLKISNTKMTIFKFSMLSFKEGDAQTTNFQNSDIGTIEVTYTVDAYTLAATGGSFRVDVSLGYDKTTLRNQYDRLFSALSVGEGENTVSINCDVKSGSASHQLLANEIKSTYVFENVSANDGAAYSFTVTYDFHIPSANDNFREMFGQYLMGADLQGKTVTKFVASAYVTDIG